MHSLFLLQCDGASGVDLKSEYALSGDREKKLRSYALANNIDWSQFWLTALIKDKINLKKPDLNKPLITDEYKRILINEINTIKPNVLVPLSELGFNFLTGLSGIRKFRGSVLHPSGDLALANPTVRVIPTLGPDPYLYEDQKMEFITRLDFSKIARNLYETGPIKEVGYVWWAKTAGQFREFLERQYAPCLAAGGFMTFDIETFANIPTCIGFCFDGQESCCVPPSRLQIVF